MSDDIRTALELLGDPKSDLIEWVLNLNGSSWFVFRSLGSNVTHIVAVDNPDLNAIVGEVFGSVGWFFTGRPYAECGKRPRGQLVAMNPETDITCLTCKYAYERWL